jgi:hypothetical protein
MVPGEPRREILALQGKEVRNSSATDGGDNNKEGPNVFKLIWHKRRIMTQTVNCCENETILAYICNNCFLKI